MNGFKFHGNDQCCTTMTGIGKTSTISSMSSATSSTTGNATVGGNLTVTRTLTTSSFYSMKPYICAFVLSNALSTTL